MRLAIIIAQTASVAAIGGAVDAVARVGYPIVSALALGAWSVYQDRVARQERAAAEDGFRQERKVDRDAHLAALVQVGGELGKLRDAVLTK